MGKIHIMVNNPNNRERSLMAIKKRESKRLKMMVVVSELCYKQNFKQETISKKLYISKYMVRRLLKEARNKGIIRISIGGVPL